MGLGSGQFGTKTRAILSGSNLFVLGSDLSAPLALGVLHVGLLSAHYWEKKQYEGAGVCMTRKLMDSAREQ